MRRRRSRQFAVCSSQSAVHRCRSAVRILILVPLALAGCARKAPMLPVGNGTPFPGFAAAYDQATASCRAIKTITASMGMSGKAGSTKLRGRIDAGFAAPDRARLEGIPPFGKPVFVLVAEGGRGTLVLTREDRVLRDAPPDQIVEALAGVPLGPGDLRTAIAGCGIGGSPGDGHEYSNGWIAAPAGDGTVYLRRAAAGWEVAAATRGPVTISYDDYAAGRPATIRIRATSGARTQADLTLRLSDVDINTPLDPRTFEVVLPDHAVPLTLDELRRAGPLGGASEAPLPTPNSQRPTPKSQLPIPDRAPELPTADCGLQTANCQLPT
jgi:outer membrane lipoprotein-sorting protein